MQSRLQNAQGPLPKFSSSPAATSSRPKAKAAKRKLPHSAAAAADDEQEELLNPSDADFDIYVSSSGLDSMSAFSSDHSPYHHSRNQDTRSTTSSADGFNHPYDSSDTSPGHLPTTSSPSPSPAVKQQKRGALVNFEDFSTTQSSRSGSAQPQPRFADDQNYTSASDMSPYSPSDGLSPEAFLESLSSPTSGSPQSLPSSSSSPHTQSASPPASAQPRPKKKVTKPSISQLPQKDFFANPAIQAYLNPENGEEFQQFYDNFEQRYGGSHEDTTSHKQQQQPPQPQQQQKQQPRPRPAVAPKPQPAAQKSKPPPIAPRPTSLRPSNNGDPR